jgi:putative peptidoglycan lipid II flippase
VNVAASIALMGPLGTAGIALANGVASLAGLLFLTMALRRRMGRLPYHEVLGGWLVMALAAGLMGALAWAGARWMDLDRFRGLGPTSLRLLPLITLCSLVYAGLLFALRVPEARSTLAMLRRKLFRL